MEDAEIQIVRLPPEEWQAYKALRLRALQEEPQAFGATYAENSARPDAYWRERLQDAQLGGSWLVFARVKGDLVGMMGGYRHADDAARIVNIIAVFVVAAARGRGIAAQLLGRLIVDISADPAVTALQLAVNKTQTSAVALYQRFGFKVVGQVMARMGDGRDHEEYMMERRIERPVV